MRKDNLSVKGGAPVIRRRRKRFSWDDLELTLLSLPSIIWLIAFCYVPLFGIVFAFKNYKYKPGKGFLYSLFVSSKWVGLKNFEFLFRSPDVANIFRNTLGYNVVFLLIGVTLPVTLAIMITQLHSRKVAKVCQTAVFLPHFLSWVVISYFVFAFLSTDKGLINSLIVGLGGERILWYQDAKYWDVAGSLNGKIYAVPTLKDMASQQFFRLDKERFEAIGCELPDEMAFADLEPLLKAYKENYDDLYPLMMGKGGLTGMTNSAQWIAGNYLCSPYHLAGTDRENKIIPFWEDEVLMERYQLLHKWYELGYINPDAATIESIGSDIRAAVRSGSAWKGYYAGYSSWAGIVVHGASYAGPFMSTATMRGAMNAVNAAADEETATACLKYLELLNTDRVFRDILRYGVEGTHFNYTEANGNKVVERTEQGINNWSMDGFVTGSVVNASCTTDSYYDWAEIFKDYENAIVSTLGTFTFNNADVEAECAACSAVMEKYTAELLTGTLDIDAKLETIKAELIAAGIETVQAEAQAQLDAYLAGN